MAMRAHELPQQSYLWLVTPSLSDVMEECLPMVRRIAGSVSAQFGTPTGMDTDDLVSCGLLGLAEAHKRFDSARGGQFSGFAAIRVRGAMLDAIRKQDWVPRKVRARLRSVKEAETIAGISETNARRMAGVSPLEVFAQTFSLDEAGAETMADPGSEVGQGLEEEEEKSQLSRAIENLDERSRLIVTLFYFEEIDMTKIARILGVSESRVSQLHGKALMKMRPMMAV